MSLIFNLKHLGGSLAGQNQRMALPEGQPIRLGRGPDSDVRFSESADDNVSAVHAELSSEGGRLYIEDKRSSNGTFVNGAPCPAFERIAVPDGSRIRLAQNGPEMQITFDQVAEAAPPPPPPTEDSSLPPRQAVGRETMLREIDRAKQEERDVMTSEVSKSKRMTVALVAAVAFLALCLVGLAGFRLYQTTKEKVEIVSDEAKDAKRNVWADVEQSVRPAVAHVRCRYHLERPEFIKDQAGVMLQMRTLEVTGSAILIRPDLLLTAKHLVEPWKFSFDWSSISEISGGGPISVDDAWEKFSEASKIIAVPESFEVQFPGFQPVTGTIFAISKTSDLALISIPQVKLQHAQVATTNRTVNVTDEVGIIGYPLDVSERLLVAFDNTSASTAKTQLTNVEPTFLKGTVTRSVTETGDPSHLFYLDASVRPGNSGGPVLNKEGEVIGIVSHELEVSTDQKIKIYNKDRQALKEVKATARAVSPNDMKKFLSSVGIL